ncbi:Ino80, partial [Drosophila busckii]
ASGGGGTELQPRLMAEPLHIQRLEAALNMRPFMQMARQALKQPLSSGEGSATDLEPGGEASADSDDSTRVGMVQLKQRRRKRILGSKEGKHKLHIRQSVKTQLYNFNDLTSDREWLYDMLLSDTESEEQLSDEDEYISQLLREHMHEQRERKRYYKKPTNAQYAYYGSGLLSNHDVYAERQQATAGVRKRRRRTKQEILLAKLAEAQAGPKPAKQRRRGRKKRSLGSPESGEVHPSELGKYSFGDTLPVNDEDDDENGVVDYKRELANFALDFPEEEEEIEEEVDVVGASDGQVTRVRRRRKNPEVLAARRRRIWQIMSKKETVRLQRIKSNNHKEMLANCKRIAGMCAKVVRQRATNSQRIMKETVWRAKRLTREMLTYWKRYERVEREQRRKQEREAEEQRKQDVELIEVKRQQRKLNFLITQTELYAHFMSKKLGQGTEADQLRILSQLDEEHNARLAAQDDYDAGEMKQLAQANATAAMQRDLDKTRAFDVRFKKEELQEQLDELPLPARDHMKDLPQPQMFKGTLKAYQIKGMTWLANIYDQGISGILADEMGLGKTVQSIAFLCHIAEHYGVWGPFLIISPASTLHNWQQEMERFVPDFNVVPYWGSPNERKILRQFWDQKHLHTREASFHVVITSYQLVVSDYKYFNRIKWQYMVLDEAQAIKSAASQRWKLLLGFNCRNRLLLSGTPIQNSMAELWALLHFIMPTLFDSHDEFNEWFSKDIESHAENKTGIDELQISRLHMILKPFMLRRIKKDVENELSDKIEIMVYCPLTIRQKLLYRALKQKIRIEDLLHIISGSGTAAAPADGSVDRNFTSNLMNLVMQFRKVCNHPELFERRDAKSPFSMRCAEFVLPRLVYDDGLLHSALPSRQHLLYNRFNIFKSAHMQRGLYNDVQLDNCFSFTRLADLSLSDMEDVSWRGLIAFLLHYRRVIDRQPLLAYRCQWWPQQRASSYQLLEPTLERKLMPHYMLTDSVLRNFIFTAMTSNESSVYAFGNYHTINMQETIEHRVIRSKVLKQTPPLIEELAAASCVKQELESVEVQTKANAKSDVKLTTLQLLPEFVHRPRKPQRYECEPLQMPRFLYGLGQRVQAVQRHLYCESRAAAWTHLRHLQCENVVGRELVRTGLALCKPRNGWSSIIVPDKETLITDAGKLFVLDTLLTRLKAEGHRVLIYSQMTKMIDLLEEYMWHRKHRYMRLDGSSKISARRDMVADFQSRADIFVFLLSTRAGGLGINLTAADTVIFYDSDWNPTVDQQAMDRAHRLGQTKQVTVYRLICKGTIEERILERAREKSEIQRMVISGGNFKPDTLKPKEVVSLLLDDEEIEMKYRQEAKLQVKQESSSPIPGKVERKRRQPKKESNMGGVTIPANEDDVPSCSSAAKRIKQELDEDSIDVGIASSTSSAGTDSNNQILSQETYVPGATSVPPQQLQLDNDSDNEALIVDGDSPTLMSQSDSMNYLTDFGGISSVRRRHHPRGTKRGRPRGSTRRGGGHGSLQRVSTPTSPATPATTTAAATGTGTTTSPLPQQEAAAAAAAAGNAEAAANTPATFGGMGTPPSSLVKRGPGRPRSKTSTPVSRGTRGAPRARRPMGPLLVPLGCTPDDAPAASSPATSRATSP